jgi:radical SAM protein with 4Fe4S-binding SPASM domain
MGVLKDHCYLKHLEEPVIYDAAEDELFVVDEEAFGRVLALDADGRFDVEAVSLLRGEGLLQNGPRRNPVYIPGKAPRPSLRYMEIQITGRCDKACRHCYQGRPSKRDMLSDTFARILDQFERMQGLKVMVSGGEPLCHPRFEDLLQVLDNRTLRKVLLTHGEGVDAETARSLSTFDQVQVSLDGWGHSHDSLRGPGSFSRALAGIEALIASGIKVGVATMVHSANLGEFHRMSKHLVGLGVEEWGIDVPCSAGRWQEKESEDQDLVRAMSDRLRFAFGGGYHGGSDGLSCGAHLMTVFPDATAAKCGFYLPEASGRADRDLAAAWQGVWQIPLEDLTCDCDFLEECAGGCRYRAQVQTGDRYGPDIVQCFARGVEIRVKAEGKKGKA